MSKKESKISALSPYTIAVMKLEWRKQEAEAALERLKKAQDAVDNFSKKGNQDE